MNQNVTLSFGLSLLTLLVLTLLLYEPDAPSGSSEKERATKPTSAPRESADAAEANRPAAGFDGNSQRSESSTNGSVAGAGQPNSNEKHASAFESLRGSVNQETVATRSETRGPMTRVADGETLSTFAKRVYGPDADPIAVWRSNRDILDGPDDPIVPGTMLRTP